MDSFNNLGARAGDKRGRNSNLPVETNPHMDNEINEDNEKYNNPFPTLDFDLDFDFDDQCLDQTLMNLEGLIENERLSNVFLPTDEWSAVSNNKNSQQGLQSSPPSQCQSTVSQGQGPNPDSTGSEPQNGLDKPVSQNGSQNNNEMFSNIQRNLGGSSSVLSPQETASPATKEGSTPVDYEQINQRGVDEDTKSRLQTQRDNLSQCRSMDVDMQTPTFSCPQRPKMMSQRGSNALHAVSKGHSELPADLSMQNIRNLGFTMQRANNPQLQEHLMINLSSHNGADRQIQVAQQPSAFNNQTILQARRLIPGSQPSFPNNCQVPFNLTQTLSNQMQHHSEPELAGKHDLSQIQGRIQNPMLQGARIENRQSLQPVQASLASFTGNENNTGARSRMPLSVVFRCIEIVKLFFEEQRKRPKDNSIFFWRKLVQEFYDPVATERWCLSSYAFSTATKNAQGLLPGGYWFCDICGKQPGRGFEYGTDILPRILKIKFDSGLLDEHLFPDMPEESYILPSGNLVMVFPHAVHHSIFQGLRVVRNGKLRVSFNSSLKILSWEFCCQSHSESVPRNNFLQQAQQLSKLAREAEREGFDKDPSNLKNHCDMFTVCAKQFIAKLEAPHVNDLGFSKRHVRNLQIAEVFNSMKDLISYEKNTGLGPIESLKRFPPSRKRQKVWFDHNL